MKIAIPERKKLVYETRIAMRWGDMDAMGHLNNANYFRYIETARVDWFQQLGCMAHGHGAGPLIVNAFCNFYAQLQYPGEVIVTLYASDPGRTTFETWAQLARADAPDVVCAEGGGTTMWVDFDQGKAAALPDWLRALVVD
ncbi:MAG TPA: thioesterase family protein [Pseudorhodoferax sp.]|nr:thioesterase family protein [Pseudorhodoferax sp.]